MYNRVKQFIRAAFARVEADELKFADTWLTTKEKGLFRSMSIIDQRHCLNVAVTARSLAEGRGADIKLLMRAALLHDCGRPAGSLGLFAKSLAVVLDKIAGKKQLLRYAGTGWLFSNMVKNITEVYYKHPAIGAARLSEAGAPAVLSELVARHHQPLNADDEVELAILKQADALN